MLSKILKLSIDDNLRHSDESDDADNADNADNADGADNADNSIISYYTTVLLHIYLVTIYVNKSINSCALDRDIEPDKAMISH